MYFKYYCYYFIELKVLIKTMKKEAYYTKSESCLFAQL